ncbi:MAG: hypothetical protein QM788_12060 [Roseateles sp.]|uniref:hypothetical protein n=1 Tax=Roseateles sp. TaxID=1971397 RepID=UPI0039E87EA7
MYGLMGSLKAAGGRCAEPRRLLPAVKALLAQAMPLTAAFGERRETRPVGGHAL